MPLITCPPGYVYNPDTGKCIKESGVTAKRLLKKYGSITRTGTCSGTILQASSGITYCSKAARKMAGRSDRASPVINDRMASALREVKRTLMRKDQRIKDLMARVDAASRTKASQVASLEKQLEQCEKRVNSLITKMAGKKS